MSPRNWDVCSVCGATEFDGTYCLNCRSFTGNSGLLIEEGAIHLPTTREARWTLCGIWTSREGHPVYKRQKTTTKKKEVTCQMCLGRLEAIEKNSDNIPRERP